MNGRLKYIIIYLFSAITASLMSVILTDSISAGASGALFGLLGALLYFGYHYRVFLGGVLKSQIIPLIILVLPVIMLNLYQRKQNRNCPTSRIW